MSYQEKNIIVSLFSTSLIFGIYLMRLYGLYQTDSLSSVNVFTLWGVIIVLGIVATIISHILTLIVLAIVHKIRTNQDETFIEDERDKLIDLKGARNAYYVLSIGVLVSMVALVVGLSPLVMFNLLIISAMVSGIIGDLSRLYFYRRGF